MSRAPADAVAAENERIADGIDEAGRFESGRVYHVVGPPGTGKTTYLSRQARLAADRHGPQGVLIAALTRAAAVEIGSRDTGIPHQNIGTLHSLCYRAVGEKAGVLDSPKGIPIWNEWVASRRPGWTLSGGIDPNDPLDRKDQGTEADELLERMGLLRHRMVPAEDWPPAVRAFAAEWLACMEEHGMLDFTSMIEAGLDLETAPGNPGAILLDEYQDFSALEAAVVKKWAASASTTICVGDEDQVLYQWRGSNPRIFLDDPVPPERHRVLSQSHRVPRAVHEFALRVIRSIPDRADHRYLPTAVEGAVRYDQWGRWVKPERWLDDVLADVRRAETEGGGDPARGVMVLASCGYMLAPLIRLLRSEGIPFANRYRTRAGQWNPLAGAGRGRRTGADQLAAFLGGDEAGWTWDQLRTWVPLLRARGEDCYLAMGAKAAVERSEGGRPTPEQLAALWRTPEVAAAALARDPRWLAAGCTEKDAGRIEYPTSVVLGSGVDALTRPPILTIGSVHSVKGGEAAHVYLINSLPPRWAESPRDPSLCRMFYVGATRARETLTFLDGDQGGFQP